eukprot:scaffold2789_cov108-Isochrysis_galbana.AAC.1
MVRTVNGARWRERWKEAVCAGVNSSENASGGTRTGVRRSPWEARRCVCVRELGRCRGCGSAGRVGRAVRRHGGEDGEYRARHAVPAPRTNKRRLAARAQTSRRSGTVTRKGSAHLLHRRQRGPASLAELLRGDALDQAGGSLAIHVAIFAHAAAAVVGTAAGHQLQISVAQLGSALVTEGRQARLDALR